MSEATYKYNVNTSANSEYFSRLINLICSVIRVHDKRIQITVWDLGLSTCQKVILGFIGVKIQRIPPFCPHWDLCYTWKMYVLRFAEDDIFFHLDAGNTIMKKIDGIYEAIKNTGYFFIDQGQLLGEIAPKDYMERLTVQEYAAHSIFAAGNIGLNKANPILLEAIEVAYQEAVDGHGLGYSHSEIQRSRNERTNIIKSCKRFRHDQTLINCSIRKLLGECTIHSHKIYAALSPTKETVILNNRKIRYVEIFKSRSPFIYFCVPYMSIVDFFYFVRNKLLGVRNRVARIIGR